VLQKAVGMNVLVPDGAKPPFATMYLLHGLSDDYTIWMRRTRIEIHAANYPLIVVMPDGFRNFYTTNEQGRDFAKDVGVEIPTFVERMFPAKPERASRCVTGLSMGGYGALRIALGYPDRFASAVSHSGALMIGSRQVRQNTSATDQEFRLIFGSDPVGSNHDLLHLAARAKRKKMLPAIRIDCGTEDFLFEDNRKIHEQLTKLRVPHEYEEFPGNHNWDYWDVHVQEALAFHARALSL
jgi:putative tributyrin esterase